MHHVKKGSSIIYFLVIESSLKLSLTILLMLSFVDITTAITTSLGDISGEGGGGWEVWGRRGMLQKFWNTNV